MKLETTRTDLNNSRTIMSFQRAFVVYLATQGYTSFEHVMTIDKNGLVSCIIEPALDNTQKNDLIHQMNTLHSVTIKQVGSDVEYVFA